MIYQAAFILKTTMKKTKKYKRTKFIVGQKQKYWDEHEIEYFVYMTEKILNGTAEQLKKLGESILALGKGNTDER